MKSIIQFLLLISLAISTAMTAEVIQFNDNGGWCWYQDERVIVHDGKLILATVASEPGKDGSSRKGDIEVASYDISKGGPVEKIILHKNLQSDDHNTPALLALPNGNILAMYSKHSSDHNIRYRITQKSGDLSVWSDEHISTRKAGACYSNVFQLSSEKGRIYDFYRGENYNPNFIISDDNGKTWEYGGHLIRKDKHRPYVKYASNNKDKIHFVTTEGHPRDYDNSIYHGYIFKGKVYDSFGKEVGDLSTGPVAPEQLTKVYAGNKDNVAWTIDLHLNKNGKPYTVFSVQKDSAGMRTGSGGEDIRYYFAKFNGKDWQVNEIAYAGSKLYSGEDDYSGLAALDPQNPDRMIISTNADPVSGKPLMSNADGDRHYELFEGLSGDDGKTWKWQPLTKNSLFDNLRPVIPIWDSSDSIVLWLRGKLDSYTWYNLEVVGVLNPKTNDPVLCPKVEIKQYSNDIDKADIMNVMTAVADWQIANPSRHNLTDWTTGAYWAGLTEFARIYKTDKYLEELKRLGDKTSWKLGRRKYFADDQAVGQMYIDMYLKYKDPQMLKDTKEVFDYVIKNRSYMPLDLRRPINGKDRYWWCDSLFMGPPVLAKLTTATGDMKYIDFMTEEWKYSYYYLYDQEEHLFFRDCNYFDKRESNGKKVFWSRGNGWVMGGLVRVLDEMPKDYPDRPFFEKLYKEMSAKVAAILPDDGLWHSSLLDPVSFPSKEASGSGFYTYALAWGINRGYLDKDEYLPIVTKAWQNLVGCVHPSGKLGYVQPIGADPRKVQSHQTEIYGVGAFLLAGSEMIKLAE